MSAYEKVSLRSSRLRLGIGTLAISKVLAFATQVLAIPIAVRSCGLDTYTLYLGLVAGSLLPSILLLRLGPVFTARIAALVASGRVSTARISLRSALFITLMNTLLAASVATILAITLPIEDMLGNENQKNILLPIVVLSALNIAGGLLGTLEAFQAGLQETHLLAVRASISNVLTAVLLFTVVPLLPGLWTLIVVLQVCPQVSRLANAIILVARHKAMLLEGVTDFEEVRNLLPDSISYTLIAGPCNYISFQLPILLIATWVEGPFVGFFGICMDLVMQVVRGMGVVLGPAVPAMSDAVANGETSVAKSIYRRTFWLAYGVGVASVGFFILGGVWFAFAWGMESISLALVGGSAGLYLWVTAVESATANYLYATAPKPIVSRVYQRIWARAAASFVLMVSCVLLNMPMLMFICLVVALCAISLAPLVAMAKSLG